MSILAWLACLRHTEVRSRVGLGGECVDLINLYLDTWKRPMFLGPTAAGLAMWRPSGAEWVANTPTNHPSLGDVVVWTACTAWAIGKAGHTAIALVADSDVLVTADQNWPVGNPVSFVTHDYSGVVGWLRFLY